MTTALQRYTGSQELMYREAAGPLVALLDDPEVMEFRCNDDGRVFVQRFNQAKEEVPGIAPAVLDMFLSVVAHLAGAEWRAASPLLHAAFPELGVRIEAGRPPISAGIWMVVRKHPTHVFPLDDFEAKCVLTSVQRQAIEDALTARKTLLISGPMFSGKTALLNACLHFLDTSPLRFVVLEDQPELICTAADKQMVHESRLVDITLYDLCQAAMRMSPGWLIVGEVRGRSALDMLKIFQTGHPGLCTVHAKSALHTLKRLENLVLEASLDPQRDLIGEAINVIVHLEPYGALSRCTAVLGVEGWTQEHGYQTRSLA